ncbi:MAG: hypothetical protein GEU90_12050, partial [Gemmatimonas sp.]|nr:hypothetical protein [Gemmatimonas sp.]
MTNVGIRRLVPIGFYAMALVASGCDESAPTSNPLMPAAASLDIVAGDQQTGAAGSELPAPLVVRVLDAAGNSVPNQIVNFRVTGGGGSVYAGVGLTNSEGMVQERWTLGDDLGLQTLQARAVDATTGEGLVFATFEATAVHPDSLVAPNTPGISTMPLSADSFTVTATWNPVSDASSYSWRGGSNSGVFAHEGEGTGTSVTFTAQWLSDSGGYWFCVAAVDAGGNASESACNSYAVPDSPPPGIIDECLEPRPGWIFCDDFEA